MRKLVDLSTSSSPRDIKDWLNNNRDKMNELDIKDKYGDQIDDFFSNITDIYSTNRIGLHNNIHSTNGVGLHNDIYSTNRIGLHKTKEGNNLDGFFSVFNNNHIKDI